MPAERADQPTEWELMLQSLKLNEAEAWRQLEISGSKSYALRLWIEQNHHQRYIPLQFLTRRQIKHGSDGT